MPLITLKCYKNIGWMPSALLPNVYSLHTQGRFVMYYFLVFIPYTHRVDLLYITSQCLFPTHTG